MPGRQDPFPSPETSSAFLAALVEYSDDGVVSTDLSGRIRTWNKGAERIFGYTAEEMIGRTLSVLMPGGTGAFTPVLDRLRAGERLDRVEAVRIAKSGRLVHVATMGTAVRDREGKVIGALAVVRDISAQKRADSQRQASEARWRAIFDGAADAIIVIDAGGRIETVNRTAERIFGYRKSEMLGRQIDTLMPVPGRDRHDGDLPRDLSAGEPQVVDTVRKVVAVRKDGTTFAARLSVGPWQVDGERHFTLIVHDPTRQVQNEEERHE